MSAVTLNGPSLAVHDVGLIAHDVQLMLFDAEKHKPRTATAVWVLMRDPEDDLCWEHAEWQDGQGLFPAGWYLMGMERTINQDDYQVVLWCYEPPTPNLKALGWGAS